MADFSVQRGVSTIASGNSTVTITAGSEYTAPSAITKAFIRICGTRLSGLGEGNVVSVGPDEFAVSINNPGNLLTSIIFERTDTTNSTRIDWEIIEYIGSASGANEFKVLDQAEIGDSTTGTSMDGAAATPADDNDVVVWITGQRYVSTADSIVDAMLYTSEWVAASNVPRFTRIAANSGARDLSYAVVEFTGSNWKIQRASHTYSAAGSTETETITAVNDLTRAFVHGQLRTGNSGLDELGQECWLSSTTVVSFFLVSGAGVNHIGVAWVIENTQTDGTPMDVQHVSGSKGTGGGEPEEWTETITAVSATDETSVVGGGSTSTGTGTSVPRGWAGLRLTDTTTVTLWRGDTGQTTAYRFDVVEWPTVAAGAVVLTVADLLVGVAAESPALVQANLLAVADSLVAVSTETPALTQANLLTTADALVAVATESPDLVQAHLLGVADATVGITADNVGLTQANVLAIADALIAVAMDSPALTQAYLLSVADALVAISADNVTLSISTLLVVADATVAVSTESPGLVQANLLTVADASVVISIDNVTLSLILPSYQFIVIDRSQARYMVTDQSGVRYPTTDKSAPRYGVTEVT